MQVEVNLRSRMRSDRKWLAIGQIAKRAGVNASARSLVYADGILLSALGAILFLGGWMSPIPYAPFTYVPGVVWFALKIAFLLFVFSWTKGTLPRYRYDQLMRLGWKIFLPTSLVAVVVTSATLKAGTTFITINASLTYRISLRARWMKGSNQLNTRLWHNRRRAMAQTA